MRLISEDKPISGLVYATKNFYWEKIESAVGSTAERNSGSGMTNSEAPAWHSISNSRAPFEPSRERLRKRAPVLLAGKKECAISCAMEKMMRPMGRSGL